jgi:phage shock protein A
MIEKFREAILKKRAEFDAIYARIPQNETKPLSSSALPLIDKEIAELREMLQQQVREFEELSKIAFDAIGSADEELARSTVEACQRMQGLFERTKANLQEMEKLRVETGAN